MYTGKEQPRAPELSTRYPIRYPSFESAGPTIATVKQEPLENEDDFDQAIELHVSAVDEFVEPSRTGGHAEETRERIATLDRRRRPRSKTSGRVRQQRREARNRPESPGWKPPPQSVIDRMSSKEHGDLIHQHKNWFYQRGAYLSHLWPVPIDEFDGHPFGCFRCGKPGHRMTDCPEPEPDYDICHNCGRREVTVFSCPRCWRAKRESLKLKAAQGHRESQQLLEKVKFPDQTNGTNTDQPHAKKARVEVPVEAPVEDPVPEWRWVHRNKGPRIRASDSVEVPLEVVRSESRMSLPSSVSSEKSITALEAMVRLTKATRNLSSSHRDAVLRYAQRNNSVLFQLLSIAEDDKLEEGTRVSLLHWAIE